MTMSERLIRSIESATGESIETLRTTPLAVQWTQVGWRKNCISNAEILTHDQAEKMFQDTFRKLAEVLK